MSWEKQASVAPARTHQVEGMLPQVLWEVGRGLLGSCCPWRVHQQIVSCSHNSQEQGGGARFVQGEPMYCKHDKRGWKAPLITD